MNIYNAIIFLSQDLYLSWRGKDSLKNFRIIHPTPELETKVTKKGKYILFVTVPIFEKNFKKRGVENFFRLAGYLNKNSDYKLLVLNRWVEGAHILEEFKLKYSCYNTKILSKYEKNISQFYRNALVLINLDEGSDTPQFPLSVAEAIACSCPIVAVSDKWLINKVHSAMAGIISNNSVDELVSAIDKISTSILDYKNNAHELSKQLFSTTMHSKYSDYLIEINK
ncbi:MAG: hypothetical protein H6774_03775 [Pseudomonadales bacterium]|nr:hypothetical protein [Pseudomonadales bacterium]